MQTRPAVANKPEQSRESQFRRALGQLSLLIAIACCSLGPISGCSVEGPIEVDCTSHPVRFIVNHRGWPRPFWSPRINEFAIASEADGPVWQLQADDSLGVPARQLAFVYGQIPPGFIQIFPDNAARPKALKPARNYFVAAGGPKAVFKMVFAVPVEGYAPVLPEIGNPGATSAPSEPTSQSAEP